MEQIKLEVGKKYRVRNPKEVKAAKQKSSVKIIYNDGSVYHPFKGDNGLWYQPNGLVFSNEEDASDLIEQIGKCHGGKRREGVTKVKKSFSIDIELVRFLNLHGNQSQYINNLIRRDITAGSNSKGSPF